ncbi:hypothetical protein [Candidatus Palauibacter sp.]|uniref:hypothetical protein n=1 Tax=Candidatus Palauibacter sp. TaxID=3101350 RepID=UPI003B01E008
MSDPSPVNTPTIDDCLELLTRIPVPRGQIQLYQALLSAGSKGATTQELVSAMGRRDEKDLTGVLGALGHRVNGTPGYGATRKPGILMILQIDEAEEGWLYRLKPVMREALEAHSPSWLPNTADPRMELLVALVRSRFPGWLSFEDPRFNRGPLDEVGYKLATQQKAEDVLSKERLSELLAAGDADEVIDRLVRIGSDNNLLFQPNAQIGDLRLLHHDGLDRPAFCDAFIDLLYGEGDTPARLDRYVRWVSSQNLDSINRWALPTYFLFFLDVENEIFVKPQGTRNLLKLGGWDIQFGPKPTGDDYARIRDAYHQLREALADYGPRHMIDVQSFGWVAQEEAERQRKARQEAESRDFRLDPRVEAAMADFEGSADANYLIQQARRIHEARERFRQDFGSTDKLRSLAAETFVDFMNEVDAHGGDKGLFSINIVASRNPKTKAFQNLQEDLPSLRTALTQLLHADGTVAERIDAMWENGHDVRNYITENLTVPSVLLFVQDPSKWTGVLPMSIKRDKLIAADHMPPATPPLGERFEAMERALTELPARYGRSWTPEARKEFYFSEAFKKLEGGQPPPPTPRPKYAFDGLVEVLRDQGLRFSREVVANYVLALQAKRFAILTGISGTGKTQVAMAIAGTFRATIRDRRIRIPKERSRPDGTVNSREVDKREAKGEMILRRIVEGRVWIEKGSTRTQLSVGEVLSTPGLDADEWEALRSQGILVRAHEEAVYFAYKSPLIGELMADTIIAHNWWDSLNQLPGVEKGGQHRFPRWRSSTIRVPFHLIGVGQAKQQSDQHQIEFVPPDTEVAERELDNSVVVPVRPDWVDNRGLLGYFNPLTNEYSTTPFLSLLLDAQAEVERAQKEKRDPYPFFVVLDEMNLARVEHYFSDFLSALESGEPIPLHNSQEIEEGQSESEVPRNLRVPDNVFFTGTVNVDETTYVFSPKVLDRAFTIEFDRVDLKGYTTGEGSDELSALDLSADDEGLRLTPYSKPGRDDWLEFTKLGRGRFYQTLLELQGILEPEHRHFGYRVANEIARFVNLAAQQSTDSEKAAAAAFDLALLQKVLPKFHGTQQELEPLLRKLFRFAVFGSDRAGSTDDDLELEKWRVVDGRLTPESKKKPVADAGVEGDEASAESGGSERAAVEPGSDEATAPRENGLSPVFPRTGAKVWRMLQRLQQRGFTSFIE